MRCFIIRRSRRLSFHAVLVSVLSGAFYPNAFAQSKEKDPDEIGNRKVDGKVNLYSIEKEIALGKGMAQDVERQARIVNDPVIAEYVNRVGQNLVRKSDAKAKVFATHPPTDDRIRTSQKNIQEVSGIPKGEARICRKHFRV